MCADAGHVGAYLFFALGSALALFACSWQFAYLPIVAALLLAVTAGQVSAAIGTCVLLADSSAVSFQVAESATALVYGGVVTVGLLALVWVAQLTVVPITHFLCSGDNPRLQRELGVRVRQIMTVYALIITFAVGGGETGGSFFEKLVSRVAAAEGGITEFSWPIFVALAGMAVNLVSRGLLLIVIPLFALVVVTGVFTIFSQRIIAANRVRNAYTWSGQSRIADIFARGLPLLQAPLAIFVFVVSLSAVDLFLLRAEQGLGVAVTEPASTPLTTPTTAPTSASANGLPRVK